MTEIHIVRLDETAAKINKAIRQIDDGAELAPVAHGRWACYSASMMECSACGRHTARHRYAYCPHCGARMDLEVDA